MTGKHQRVAAFEHQRVIGCQRFPRAAAQADHPYAYGVQGQRTQRLADRVGGEWQCDSSEALLVPLVNGVVVRVVQDQRDARYNLLRGYFRGADDDTINERDEERLATVTLPLATNPVGKPLGSLALHAVGVRVVSLRRSSGKTLAADDALVLEGGDTLVLSGHAEALAVAEEKILRGRALKNNPAAA